MPSEYVIADLGPSDPEDHVLPALSFSSFTTVFGGYVTTLVDSCVPRG